MAVFVRGIALALLFSVALWLTDVVALMLGPAGGWQPALVALALTPWWALPAAIVAGALWALSADTWTRGWSTFRSSGPEGSAWLLTTCGALTLFVAGSHGIAAAMMSAMQQELFMALGIAIGEAVLLVALLVLAVSLQGVVRPAVKWLAAQHRVLSGVLEKPLRMAALLLGLLAAATVGVCVVRWSWVQALPWPAALKLLGALAVTWVLVHMRWIDRVGRFGWSATGLLLLAAILFTLRLGHTRALAMELAQTETLSGRLGRVVLLRLFDFDRDLQLSFAGDGDCAHHDARIYSGAVDVPENGVDEDCDGRDARRVVIPRGLYTYAKPEGVPVPKQIFLITVDALQADRVFAKSGGRLIAPAMSALAQRGVHFDAAFSAGSVTKDGFPPMFTSRWSSQIARSDSDNPPGIAASEVMLAEVLKQAGFDTLAVLPNVYFFPSIWEGMTQGFTDIVELPNTSRVKGGIHNADEVRKAAVAALEKRDATAPLFAWVHFFDAHTPYTAAKGAGIDRPKDSSLQSRYDTEVQLIDRELGKLLNFIDKRGYSEPLIILTADHGTSFDPRHEKPYGQDLYSDIVRVPLIVQGRGLSPKRVRNAVSTMDLMPTLLNLLGITRSVPIEGVSLVPDLTTGKSRVKRILHHQLWEQSRVAKREDPLRMASVRDDKYHFIHDRDRGRTELYDYRSDSDERRDLSRDPRHAAANARLRMVLSQLLDRVLP